MRSVHASGNHLRTKSTVHTKAAVPNRQLEGNSGREKYITRPIKQLENCISCLVGT